MSTIGYPLHLEEIHRRIASGLGAGGDWHEVSDLPGSWRYSVDGWDHHGFALEVQSTAFPSPEGTRRRGQQGYASVESSCLVTWLHMATVDDGRESYREALRAERQLVRRLLTGVDRTGGLHISVQSAERQTLAVDAETEGLVVVGSIRFTCRHSYPVE